MTSFANSIVHLGRDPKKLCWILLLTITFPVVVQSNPAHCEDSDNAYGCHCLVEDQHMHIICNETNLTDIPKNLTDPLQMTFYQNKFEVLTKVAYPNLKYLNLEENQIRYIEENSFAQLSHLETLILSHNLISGLHKGTFTGLLNLKQLVLSDNPLQAIPRETFLAADLPQLQILVMKGCELHHIDDNSFDTLGSLQQLNVSNNRLIFIPTFGANLSRLTSLELGYNRLQKIDDNQFQHLISLRHLTLSDNKITYLQKSAFVGLGSSLQNLYLKRNTITIIDNEAFINMRSLSELDLTFNMITLLSADGMPWTTLHKPLLHDNPWECNCENSWLVTQHAVLQYNYNTSFTMKCSSPENLKDQDIYSLPRGVLSPCDVKRNAAHLSAGAGVAIALVIIVVVVVAALMLRMYCAKKRTRDGAMIDNANYSRMQDEARLDMDSI